MFKKKVPLGYFNTSHQLVMCDCYQHTHTQLTVLPIILAVLQYTAFSDGYCFPKNVVMSLKLCMHHSDHITC